MYVCMHGFLYACMYDCVCHYVCASTDRRASKQASKQTFVCIQMYIYTCTCNIMQPCYSVLCMSTVVLRLVVVCARHAQSTLVEPGSPLRHEMTKYIHKDVDTHTHTGKAYTCTRAHIHVCVPLCQHVPEERKESGSVQRAIGLLQAAVGELHADERSDRILSILSSGITFGFAEHAPSKWPLLVFAACKPVAKVMLGGLLLSARRTM